MEKMAPVKLQDVVDISAVIEAAYKLGYEDGYDDGCMGMIDDEEEE